MNITVSSCFFPNEVNCNVHETLALTLKTRKQFVNFLTFLKRISVETSKALNIKHK